MRNISPTRTMRIHLIRERPKPEMAPYLPAAEVVKQNDKKNPIQLKRNATRIQWRRKNIITFDFTICNFCPSQTAPDNLSSQG